MRTKPKRRPGIRTYYVVSNGVIRILRYENVRWAMRIEAGATDHSAS